MTMCKTSTPTGNKVMKAKKYILGILTALFLVITLLGFATRIESQNLKYYKSKMIENNITEVTGKSLDELMDISKDLSNYLSEGDENLLRPQFNDREVTHMRDVFKLLHMMDVLTRISLVLVIVLGFFTIRNYGYNEFYRYFLKGLLILIVVFGILVLAVSLNFQRAFTIFHELLFTNDLWLLDPKTDLMIQMLPENFFSGMALNIVRDGFSSLVILVGLGSIFISRKE